MSIILEVIHDILYVHPPHTLIVHFPIALTTVGLFFIILALFIKRDFLEQIAFADITLAAISVIAAGIAGLRDNMVFYHGRAANHIAKIILATCLFLVASATAILRWRNPKVFESHARAIYVAGYFVSFALATVLGFLGGVIIYGF